MEIVYQVAWRTKDGAPHDLFYVNEARARQRGIELAREMGKLSEGDAGLWARTGLLYDASGTYTRVSVTDRTVF